MKPALNKAKHYAPIALKVLILGLSLSYILSRLMGDKAAASIDPAWFLDPGGLLFLLLCLALSCLNWFLEIEKWRLLINSLRPVSLIQAAKQSLAAFSAAVITPNRLGEYAVKGLYFKPRERKRVALLKLEANYAQLLTTLLFGIPGLFFTVNSYPLVLSKTRLSIAAVLMVTAIGVLYLIRNKTLFVRGLSLKRLASFYSGLSCRIHLRVFLLSVGRYLVFSTLFFLLLDFYGCQISVTQAIPLITTMYLLSAAIPGFALFDFVIKGSVGVWLFSLAGLPYLPVIQATFSIWLLSFALPALIGSYYVLRFKPCKE
jgi:hypothetical protein